MEAAYQEKYSVKAVAIAERQHFQRPALSVRELLEQNADADDFSLLEGVGEAEK